MSDNSAEKAQGQANQGVSAKAQLMADIIKKKRGVTKLVPIQLDGDVATRIAILKGEHAAALIYDRDHNEDDTAPKVQDKIDSLEEVSRDTEQVFIFKSIGAPAYDELLSQSENQPTEEQKKAGADFNSDHFPAALVAASCIDPEITLEQALTIFNDPEWNGAELQRLFFGALGVNTELADIPLSKGDTNETRNSLLNSIIAMQGGSPIQPS